MQIQRLNMDSTWLLKVGGYSLLIDPWLVGSEIDGFSWLNEQWHTTEPVAVKDLPDYDAIMVTQSYEDHCHINTLKVLDKSKPIISTPKPHNRLSKLFKDRDLRGIEETKFDKNGDFENLELKFFTPDRKRDPVYYGVAIIDKNTKDTVFYSPHGFALKPEEVEQLKGCNIKLLITTFMSFKIPEIMGGHVNPGIDNAMQLVQQLKPAKVLNTHDEAKKAKGLVSKLAKIKYPDIDALLKDERLNFIASEDYNVIEI